MPELSANCIAVVKATAPLVGAHAEEITKTFYPILFRDFPQTKVLFNQSHQATGGQPRALADAIVAYALNIDNLGALLPAVGKMAERHAALNIQPEHYPMVGESLLKAIAEVLGDAVTEEVAAAWAEAYFFLADILIGAEAGKYKETLAKKGGWNGYREFKVVAIKNESSTIHSFLLEAADQGPVASHKAGQYITIRLNIPGHGEVVRNYSLSNISDGKSLQISIKKDGLVSAYLHNSIEQGDTVEITAPYGQFTLQRPERPIVLISGGVGITPTISMLKSLVQSGSSQKITFLHATDNQATHAFKETVEEISSQADNIEHQFFYDSPTEQEGEASFVNGRIDIDFITKNCDQNSDFYICGPGAMMKALYKGLKDWGVAEGQIHYEYFGPSEDINSQEEEVIAQA